MTSKRTYTVRDIPEDEMEKARLLLEWSRSIGQHGLQFNRWVEEISNPGARDIVFTDVSSS